MRRLTISIGLLVLALWLGNTNLFVTVPPDQQPQVIAHRGVHQIYVGETRTADTCTARPIAPPTHSLIANTIPSMEAAFTAGADVVELDIHLTADQQFAVFHDWTLDCQTDGQGVTHEQSMATLRERDLGYGYSADGMTFPLRGTGVGMMPTLSEVFAAALGGDYLVNFKSNRAEEGAALAAMLQDARVNDQVFGVYGGTPPVDAAMADVAGLRGFGRAALKACLFRYAAIGWSGFVPQVCRERLIAVPMDYAPFLWGWPHRFTDRMKRHGTSVILWGPYDGSGFSSGIDDAATLAKIPDHFDGFLWTNRIEVIGPLLHSR